MLLIPRHEDRLERLAEKLRLAEAITPHFIAESISDVCPRLALLNSAGVAVVQIDRLIKASAWTDLARALVAIELPGWSLRRLILEDGIWFCSLSRQSGMPIMFDDTADATHENLALAILSALVEARRKIGATHEPATQAALQIEPGGATVCCDNFS
jgi:hypothetical protein